MSSGKETTQKRQPSSRTKRNKTRRRENGRQRNLSSRRNSSSKSRKKSSRERSKRRKKRRKKLRISQNKPKRYRRNTCSRAQVKRKRVKPRVKTRRPPISTTSWLPRPIRKIRIKNRWRNLSISTATLPNIKIRRLSNKLKPMPRQSQLLLRLPMRPNKLPRSTSTVIRIIQLVSKINQKNR